MTVEGTDWHCSVVSVTDGDTLRLLRWREERISDDLLARVFDDPAQFPRGRPVRLVTLDTPERGQEGYAEAAADVRSWLSANATRSLMVTTYAATPGGFDRMLGDVWAGERSNTLSQWMLRSGNDGKGWLPYVRGV